MGISLQHIVVACGGTYLPGLGSGPYGGRNPKSIVRRPRHWHPVHKNKNDEEQNLVDHEEPTADPPEASVTMARLRDRSMPSSTLSVALSNPKLMVPESPEPIVGLRFKATDKFGSGVSRALGSNERLLHSGLAGEFKPLQYSSYCIQPNMADGTAGIT